MTETPEREPTFEHQHSASNLVGGRYRILDEIGSGGMGTVYRVEQVALRKIFAMKTLHTRVVTSNAWERFKQEAQATSQLDHPGLVQVHDFGFLAPEQPFFVMDYFNGITLSSLLKQQGAMPLSEALDLFIQIAYALAFAHNKGVVHRDIKPSNILLSHSIEPEGRRIKIVDFGIAKLQRESDAEAPLTRSGEILGTPFYMSPEQCHGRSIDHRSDIYSLGCVLFEVLTGVPPFVGDSALSTMLRHETDTPMSLREASLGGSFPPVTELIVSRMLEKNPENRYQNLLDVAKDLTDLKEGRAHEVDLQPRAAKVAAQAKRKNPAKTILVASVVALIGTAVALLPHYFHPKTAPPTAPKYEPMLEPNIRVDEPVPAEELNKTFYSSATGTVRHFRFPTTFFVGSFNKIPAGCIIRKAPTAAPITDHVVRLSGDIYVQNFKPLGLMVTDEACSKPQLLARFRPDEIASIEYPTDGSADDTAIKPIANWTALREIDCNESRASDDSIKIFETLPALETVNVSKSQITAYSFVKLTRLNSLKDLRVGECGDVLKLLHKINSKSLEELAIDRTELSSLDISKYNWGEIMPNLRALNLRANRRIDAQGIPCLTSLSKLENLRVEECPISAKVIPTLTQFKHLRNLSITTKDWTAAERAQLSTLSNVAVQECNDLR